MVFRILYGAIKCSKISKAVTQSYDSAWYFPKSTSKSSPCVFSTRKPASASLSPGSFLTPRSRIRDPRAKCLSTNSIVFTRRFFGFRLMRPSIGCVPDVSKLWFSQKHVQGDHTKIKGAIRRCTVKFSAEDGLYPYFLYALSWKISVPDAAFGRGKNMRDRRGLLRLGLVFRIRCQQ